MRPENQDASQRQDGLVNMSMAFVANLQARSVATDLIWSTVLITVRSN